MNTFAFMNKLHNSFTEKCPLTQSLRFHPLYRQVEGATCQCQTGACGKNCSISCFPLKNYMCCINHAVRVHSDSNSIKNVPFWKLWLHSSEIRGLCLMKCYSEMLQNIPYIFGIKKCTYVKSWSIFLGHFIKHKPLISEE